MIINEALNSEAMRAGTRGGKNESTASFCTEIEYFILSSSMMDLVFGK